MRGSSNNEQKKYSDYVLQAKPLDFSFLQIKNIERKLHLFFMICWVVG